MREKRPDADPLRELLHHMTARYMTLRPSGIEVEGSRQPLAVLYVQILAYGAARTLYRGRRPVCRSEGGVKSIQDPEKRCSGCLDLKHCSPQVRVDLLHDFLPYRLLLAFTSAKNFLLYVGGLPKNRSLTDIPTRIDVVNRGSWGELRFQAAHPIRPDPAPGKP